MRERTLARTALRRGPDRERSFSPPRTSEASGDVRSSGTLADGGVFRDRGRHAVFPGRARRRGRTRGRGLSRDGIFRPLPRGGGHGRNAGSDIRGGRLERIFHEPVRNRQYPRGRSRRRARDFRTEERGAEPTLRSAEPVCLPSRDKDTFRRGKRGRPPS